MHIDESWYQKPPGIPEHTSAGGVVVRAAGDHVFVALVREGDQPGYVLPKGHVDPGESPEAAARREVSEEAGLGPLISLGALGIRERLDYSRTSWKRTHYFVFMADTTAGAAEDRAEWFSLDALPPMFWPEQRDLLAAHRDDIVGRLRGRVGADVKSGVQQQFTRRAAAYARSASHRRDADLELLLRYLHPVPSDRALDVATGTGFTAYATRALVGSVVGVDLTYGMLEEARRHSPRDARIAWVVGDAEALPFADGAFTLVTCRRAPHHFARIERGIDEMVRVLARGGRLGVVDQVLPEDAGGQALMEMLEVLRDSSHVRALPAGRWRAVVADRGLEITGLDIVERRQTFDEWLELAGTAYPRRLAVAEALKGVSREALEQIGYEETPEPSFLKRWIVLVGRKRD